MTKTRRFFTTSLVAMAFAILAGCISDADVAPDHKNVISAQSNSGDGVMSWQPANPEFLKRELRTKSWYMGVSTEDDPYTSVQFVGLLFSGENEMYWADVDGTTKGTYTVENNIVEFNILRKENQLIKLSFKVIQYNDFLMFELVRNSGTIDYTWTEGPRKTYYNHGPLESDPYLLTNTTWKFVLADPDLPQFFDEKCTFFDTDVAIAGISPRSGYYVEDPIIKYIVRATLTNNERLMIVKAAIGPNYTKQLYIAHFLPNGKVVNKIFQF